MSGARFDPGLIGRAFVNPREAYAEARAMGLDQPTLWQILLLLTLVRVLLIGTLGAGVFVLPFGLSGVEVSPMAYGLVIGGVTVLTVFLVQMIGRVLGGTGTIAAALTGVILIEVISVLLTAAQLVILWVVPPLFGVASLAGGGVVLICTLIYIDEIHGFGSLLKAFGTIALGILGLSIGLAVLVTVIGVGDLFLPPQGGG